MSEEKKEELVEPTSPNCDLSPPIRFRRGLFGGGNESVPFYFLGANVQRLRTEFKVFEELNNSEAWPVSKLIQRELDRERARKICDDYLLAEGFAKFFPPLIAVLLPTDAKYLPKAAFDPPDPSLAEHVEKTIRAVDQAKYANWEAARSTAGGIVEIPFDKLNGELIWDRRKVAAVVIDGQHRLHAFREAVSRDRGFEDWVVPLVLVDLAGLCAALGQPPTDVVRDLFVKINSTPEEVDFARLILMNDRDALSSFAQVVVDDSCSEWPPAVPPELMDWHCHQGKHDVAESLTGIVTVYHVMLSSFMGGYGLESVEERTNATHVERWVERVDARLDIDALIEKEIGAAHRLHFTLDAAKAAAKLQQSDSADEDEESAIAFTYSARVAKLMRDRFRDLYLSSVRAVFHELSPYRTSIEVAKEHGVFEKNGLLHRYFRSTGSKRRTMLKEEAELHGRLLKYREAMKTHAGDSILHTVMGQKAVFGALFDLLVSAGRSEAELLRKTQLFIKRFNMFYSRVTLSNNVDERFFSLQFRMPKEQQVGGKAGDLGKSFWRGIIQKGSGDIDYGKSAVELLKSIIKQGVDLVATKAAEEPSFVEERKMVQRHTRLLVSFHEEMDDPEKLAKKIVSAKSRAFWKLVKG